MYTSRALILFLLAFGGLAPSPGTAQNIPSYVIATVAGSGPGDVPQGNVPQGEYGGDGGPATNALLNLPTSVAIDVEGNLYVVDWNARIRKIDARTHVITTIAGNGTWGFAGDGGPAIHALLGGPGNLAVDRAGDIYFADAYNHRVRRISAATGIITTVAGNGVDFDRGDTGPALQVGIGIPSGIVVDTAGNLYIANGSDRVRKVEAASGNIVTVAGAGGSRSSGDGGPAIHAQLDQPCAVALNAKGDLYIAARGEHRIRKVDAATGIITTVAGASSGGASPIMGWFVYQAGFGGDGGPATSALLNDPDSVALDSAGNVYISDTMNFRIRRIDAGSGVIHTIAGTGIRGFSGDGGPAVGAEITTPAGLAIDAGGRIYFADLFNQRIRMVATPLQFMPAFRPNGPATLRRPR